MSKKTLLVVIIIPLLFLISIGINKFYSNFVPIDNYSEANIDNLNEKNLNNREKEQIAKKLTATYILYTANQEISNDRLLGLFSDTDYGRATIKSSPIENGLQNIELFFSKGKVQNGDHAGSFSFNSHLDIKGTTEDLGESSVEFILLINVEKQNDTFLIKDIDIQFIGSE